MTDDSTVLEVKHLSVDYYAESGTVHAVTDVTFTLRRGEVLGLAGESGSGKSTLVYALTQLLPQAAEIVGGEVIYHPRRGDAMPRAQQGNGAPVNLLALTPRQFRAYRWGDLAIVFQSAMNSLNPVMTVGAQIEDVLLAHRPDMSARDRQARQRELFKLVGIAPDRLTSYPHELSGGMRQRAGIAIALALQPELVILDEPTTALDVVVQREILNELMRLRQRLTFSVIFITHDLSLLLELANHVAVMYAGKIVEQASRRELYAHPRHPYSFGLINAFPRLRGPRRGVMGIPGSPPDLRALPTGCPFHPRCPLVFEPCPSEVPQLQTTVAVEPTLVACHLYDPAFRPTPPATAEIAERYASRAERSGLS